MERTLGEMLRRQVRERYLDLMDWIDIRPDFSLLPCLGILGILVVMFATLPKSMMIAAAIFGTAFAILAFLAVVVLTLAAVVVRGAMEAVQRYRATLPTRQVPAKPLHRLQPH